MTPHRPRRRHGLPNTSTTTAELATGPHSPADRKPVRRVP